QDLAAPSRTECLSSRDLGTAMTVLVHQQSIFDQHGPIEASNLKFGPREGNSAVPARRLSGRPVPLQGGTRLAREVPSVLDGPSKSLHDTQDLLGARRAAINQDAAHAGREVMRESQIDYVTNPGLCRGVCNGDRTGFDGSGGAPRNAHGIDREPGTLTAAAPWSNMQQAFDAGDRARGSATGEACRLKLWRPPAQRSGSGKELLRHERFVNIGMQPAIPSKEVVSPKP